VICSTLSACATEQLSGVEFGMTIVDEAGQALEISCLIPLKFNSKHCVLVGGDFIFIFIFIFIFFLCYLFFFFLLLVGWISHISFILSSHEKKINRFKAASSDGHFQPREGVQVRAEVREESFILLALFLKPFPILFLT
jgi:hypothetical protein